MRKILITDSVPGFFMKKLKKMQWEVDYRPGLENRALHKLIPEYEGILVRSKTELRESHIKKAEKLKVILRPGSGLENIDIVQAQKRGIQILNSPEGNRGAVAEHALGLLLCLLNNIPRSYREISEGKWKREENRGEELNVKTVGIIGYGNTGSAFARILAGIGSRVLAYDKYKSGFGGNAVQEVSLETLFRQSEVISLHLPLTAETVYYADDEFYKSLHNPIYLINTSRGKIVQTSSLVNALKDNKIKGAGLDVLENEKFVTYALKEKEELKKLLASERVIITPHIAGWTKESGEKIYSVLLKKLSGLAED